MDALGLSPSSIFTPYTQSSFYNPKGLQASAVMGHRPRMCCRVECHMSTRGGLPDARALRDGVPATWLRQSAFIGMYRYVTCTGCASQFGVATRVPGSGCSMCDVMWVSAVVHEQAGGTGCW